MPSCPMWLEVDRAPSIFRTMTAPRRTRLSATLMLLLFVFMGGGIGVSGFDVLLFHLHQRDEIPIAHIEPAGANCHAESCLIGYTVSGGRFLSAAVQTSVVRTIDRRHVTPPQLVHPAPPARHTSPLPRSPPLVIL